jgi:drug/metabolite transporter superfamily protein YnfA
MNPLLRSAVYFLLAGLLEIGGGYLVLNGCPAR